MRCLPEDKTNGFFVSCFVRGAGEIAHEASGKRARDDDEEEDGEEEDAPDEQAPEQDEATGADTPTLPKTAAQAERARRKKQAQKAKKRLKVAPSFG